MLGARAHNTWSCCFANLAGLRQNRRRSRVSRRPLPHLNRLHSRVSRRPLPHLRVCQRQGHQRSRPPHMGVWHMCQRQGHQHGPRPLHLEVRHQEDRAARPKRHQGPPPPHLEVLMTIFRRHLRRQLWRADLPGGCTYHRHHQPPHGHLSKRPSCMPCGMGVPCGTARHRRGKAMLKNSGSNRPRRRPWSQLGSRLLGLRQLGLQISRPSQPASPPLRPPSNPQQWLPW